MNTKVTVYTVTEKKKQNFRSHFYLNSLFYSCASNFHGKKVGSDNNRCIAVNRALRFSRLITTQLVGNSIFVICLYGLLNTQLLILEKFKSSIKNEYKNVKFRKSCGQNKVFL